MQTELLPPAELIAKVEEINQKWFTDGKVKVECYNQSRHRHAWRYRIVDTETKETLIEHLSTENADGHTYRMIESSLRVQREIGFEEGRISLLVDQTILQAKQLGIPISDMIKKFQYHC